MSSKILLVDDDPTLLRFLGDYLVNHGYHVMKAANGTEALRQAYHDHPDLILLDVMMPGMDGWEVCARIREMSDVPVILVSGKTSEVDKLRGFRLGVDDYVTKPFSMAELLARIQAVLARSQPRGGPDRNLLSFGDILLDLDKRQARRADQVIPLTPTEFRLLEYMARRQGRAIAEADLATEVWGSYREENSTAVRRYIFLLRQKVELDPAHPRLILTVRGFGYRMGTGTLPPLPPKEETT
ncbi:MAG: response regulator transcription factor [Anaerolineaceae bacterium]|nr:response regulator transcription factor [Anaerolineaceae bacterium]